MADNKEGQEITDETSTENTENLTEETVAEGTETTETEDIKAKLESQLAEAKDKYLRLYAEFENFRRRTAKEKIETIQNASEGLIKELIPVIDDFERANKSFETVTEVEPLKEGISLVFSKLQKTLAAKGLKPMESKDKDFDVELHECITQFAAGEDKKGKVIDEVEKGYFLNDKVIRYAKVVVGS
jgi:molecular chaperone GrpE